MVMVVLHSECTKCHSNLYFKMIKVINGICIFPQLKKTVKQTHSLQDQSVWSLLYQNQRPSHFLKILFILFILKREHRRV